VPDLPSPSGLSFPGDDAPDLTPDDVDAWRFQWPTGAHRRALLQDDPELAECVPEAERERATRGVWADSFHLEPGPFELSDAALPDGTAALLVTGGTILMDVVLGDRALTELLLPGDLLPVDSPPVTAPESRRRITVLEDARLAVLDERFLLTIARWPGLTRALLKRLDDQKHRVATHGAICQLPRVEQRIMAILCHLASRTGRVTSAGTLFSGPSSHREIAQLIGAQRSTVSLALTSLENQGVLHRRDDRTWLLPGYTGQSIAVEDLMPSDSRDLGGTGLVAGAEA
jgi:CRP/FNR family transcriptional regulator, cyclic AMP receptor protein